MLKNIIANKIGSLDTKIKELKAEGVSRNKGIAFITFSSKDCVYETLCDFDCIKDIAKNSEASKLMKINNWNISKAPPPTDIIWENLSALTNINRKLLRALYLTIILTLSSIIIFSMVFFDKFYRRNNPQLTNAMVGVRYLTPTIFLIYNYVFVPLIIKKFIK